MDLVQLILSLQLNRTPYFTPCTPLGCIKLLEHENVDLVGKRA